MDIYGYFTLAKALLQNPRVLGVDIQGSSRKCGAPFVEMRASLLEI